ncbi:hypothetical protein NDU88_001255 [Pleurodeles waltl]|uniref:Uncharacterized protein n=1 Tax=Pleurodeles waltl TaxID=8319 RepID=A0AAV7P580_PLEWA|nr:hypothetical protein NDU88_001255 [Pleurodeles waltl]
MNKQEAQLANHESQQAPWVFFTKQSQSTQAFAHLFVAPPARIDPCEKICMILEEKLQPLDRIEHLIIALLDAQEGGSVPNSHMAPDPIASSRPAASINHNIAKTTDLMASETQAPLSAKHVSHVDPPAT